MSDASIGPARSGGPGLLVAGAGVVGLAFALATARAGWPVTLVGPAESRRNGRTVALLEGSVRLLSALGVWARVADRAAPLAVMRIVDDTRSLFRGPPVSFAASEIGLPAFGYNVENAALVEALEAAVRATAGLERIEDEVAGHTAEPGAVRVSLRGGSTRGAALLVAADGAASPTRRAAGIAARETEYDQVALTVICRHAAPHGAISTEFHTRQGPFTLVPMAPAAEAPHRSSLVWVMRPEEADRRRALDPSALAAEIEHQSRRLLGSLTLEGAVGRFPIRSVLAERTVGERLVLLGEAAHALPPIGAQGLNLSLRDAGTLADALGAGGSADPGSRTLLAAYAARRRGDVALRAFGVDALNRSLLTSLLPVDLVRSGGLAALALFPGARRAAMRYGLMPRDGVPSLMR